MITMYGLARIGRDCELRYSPQGEAVCNLSLAFSLATKGKDGKPLTQWVDAALWGKRAEALSQYLTKGRAVAVSLGDPRIETYTSRDGTPGSKLVARVNDIAFAGPAADDAGSGQPSARPAAAPAPQRQQTHGERKREGTPTAGTSFDDMDDDIPF